jgi:hypothetical protein
MALDAPCHRQLPHLRHAIHPLDLAVAFGARHAAASMRLVAEVNEARKDVHANPGDRLVGIPEAPDFGDLRIVGVHESVAAHAPFDRRDSRERGSVRRTVTELAAQLVVTSMDRMTEVDRLQRRVCL